MKYVFVTGGVTSSLGKGVMCASLGKLLKACGYQVTMQKFDLYYNAEPGLLSPLEHGEAFITEDGAATDLDLGNFERMVDIDLPGEACCTTGKIHRTLLEKEMRGDFHGSTIQAIPHVADEIKARIREVAGRSGADISIIEIGGTVGDMEASVYLEAIRQMRLECENPNDCCYVHMTYMPYISMAGELKTKPTQNSVKTLRTVGIQPDVIVCRTEVPLSGEGKDKIALFCNVKTANVIQNIDVARLCELPLMLEKEGLAKAVLSELHLPECTPRMDEWKALVKRANEASVSLRVALISKYTAMPDAYLSVREALKYAGYENGARVAIDLVDAETVNAENADELLKKYAAIVIPGGYGSHGTDGILVAAQFARENRVPCLAIGFGMQLCVVEAARHLLGTSDAHSTEIDPGTPHPVVRIPQDRICQNDSRCAARMGAGTVRVKNDMLKQIYGVDLVSERHENRYEVDPAYGEALCEKGLKLAATSLDTGYPEAFVMEDHPFYVLVVYHPEFKSRPGRCHPLFKAFVRAAMKK
ncbi:MAG: CTP synthase [Eubacteriales bacterium]|nr:CTP synthase [Eubacteriales bacterium]